MRALWIAVAALVALVAMTGSRALAAERGPAASATEAARTPAGHEAFLRGLAEHAVERDMQIANFIAANPAPPGSDRDFPYFRVLKPTAVAPVNGGGSPTLCVLPRFAWIGMKCDGAGGPAAVRGSKIKVVVDRDWLARCEPRLNAAEAAVVSAIDGVHTWRLDGSTFYLGDTPFRMGTGLDCSHSEWFEEKPRHDLAQ
jgi:hypothetical protein